MVQKLLKLNQNKQAKRGRKPPKVSKVVTHEKQTKLKTRDTRDVLSKMATKDARKKAIRGENTLIAKTMIEGHFGLDLLKTTNQALAKQRQRRDRNKQRGYKVKVGR